MQPIFNFPPTQTPINQKPPSKSILANLYTNDHSCDSWSRDQSILSFTASCLLAAYVPGSWVSLLPYISVSYQPPINLSLCSLLPPNYLTKFMLQLVYRVYEERRLRNMLSCPRCFLLFLRVAHAQSGFWFGSLSAEEYSDTISYNRSTPARFEGISCMTGPAQAIPVLQLYFSIVYCCLAFLWLSYHFTSSTSSWNVVLKIWRIIVAFMELLHYLMVPLLILQSL